MALENRNSNIHHCRPFEEPRDFVPNTKERPRQVSLNSMTLEQNSVREVRSFDRYAVGRSFSGTFGSEPGSCLVWYDSFSRPTTVTLFGVFWGYCISSFRITSSSPRHSWPPLIVSPFYSLFHLLLAGCDFVRNKQSPELEKRLQLACLPGVTDRPRTHGNHCFTSR